MAARNMSQREIDARKKLQAGVSRTTGALGLGALGALGASRIPGSRVGGKIGAGASKLPKPVQARLKPLGDKKKLVGAATGMTTVGAGVGGAGSFNFASYSSAEARQRKPKLKVQKNHPVSAFGIEH